MMIKYNFKTSGFIDFNNNYSQVKNDFLTGCEDLLIKELKVPVSSANAIALCLFCRMSDFSLYYHTPVHVLTVLNSLKSLNSKDFPQVEDPLLHLAIWFHDAIYVVGSKNNKINSADFFYSLLDGFLNEKDLLNVVNYIEATANFMEEEVDEEYNLLLDLDIVSMAWDKEDYKTVDKAIKNEFVKHKNDEAKYLEGRKKFLTHMLNKKNIYRTKMLKDKWEDKARENLQYSLDLIV